MSRKTIILAPKSHHLDKRAGVLIEAAPALSPDSLLSTRETAVWLGCSDQWLEIGRSKGWGPPFIKVSPRRVRYRYGDVLAYLDERRHRCTREYAPRKLDRAGAT